MNYSWLNLGSMLLGLTGWIAPLIWMKKMARGQVRRSGPGVALSLGCCGTSIWMQLWYGRHLVEIQDWSAILDTWPAVGWVALFLLATTLLLNFLLLWAEHTLDLEEE